MQIAIFGRSIEEKWMTRLYQVLDYFESQGVTLVWFEPFYYFIKEKLHGSLSVAPTYTFQTGIPHECSLLLNLGGDGVFLESLILTKDRDIHVAGINFGRLGFLAGVEGGRGGMAEAEGGMQKAAGGRGGPTCPPAPEGCIGHVEGSIAEPPEKCLERLITGDFCVEERLVIEVSSDALPKGFFPYALNECALLRKGPAMISISVMLQSGALPAYWADGLIVATPTGSTAYALSVGGPIVFPSADVLVVAPIAPHNLNMRPIVIPHSEELTVCAQGRAPEVILTLDNRSVSIPCGSKISIRRAPFVLQYVALQEQHFVSALHQKLLWGFDKRNEERQ